MSIGNNIATIRILKGLKQDALARTLGLNQTAISALEKCHKINEDLLIDIADALEVTASFIKNFDRAKMFKVINYPDEQVFPISKQENITMDLEAKIVELYKRLLACEKEKFRKVIN
ncbi:helix-turn-helix transcriptional regulator [Gramella sp. AN32]|uniref:Helix-turn-helix domain-containing protein n=1 Tax=Christiangramia antarctica TaxID=2058158 RepID=A0ABW5X2B1_9FLAO|nr:helix-turn-helix transcriptional regulator [Gramella sp. AN32]MCM4156733.1 transcriptional regulator [Gramella sp. AN32]